MEQQELKGVLFPNTKTSDKHPDFRGKCLIGGVKYRIAGWKRTSQAGLNFLSIAFQIDDGKYDKYKKAVPNHTEEVKQVAHVLGDTAVLDEEPLPF